MPIYKGTQQINPTDIIAGGKALQRVYVGDRLVWQKVINQIKFGLLYNFYVATDEREFTSSDAFEIPSAENWETLFNYMDTVDLSEFYPFWPIAGGKLKEDGFAHWANDEDSVEGSNEYGFLGVGAGYRIAADGSFSGITYDVSYWSKTEYVAGQYYSPHFGYDTLRADEWVNLINAGCSVRLVRPATESEQLLDDGTYCDDYIGNDGTIYKTVKIGTQVWTVENSIETKFRYDIYVNFGNFYSHDCLPNLAPSGWHIATWDDFVDLGDELGALPYPFGSYEYSGIKGHTTDWKRCRSFKNFDYDPATNELGLNLGGAGHLIADGTQYYLREYDSFTVNNSGTYQNILYSYDMVSRESMIIYAGIRLVKDTTDKTHGQTGTVTDIDGNIVPTICIAGKEWTAEHWRATKLSDGTPLTEVSKGSPLVTLNYMKNVVDISNDIPEVTDNSEWSELTTGALCAFDNDWNNV